MSKIGLVTLYNSDNYGALLQAYALQETIKSLGCSCEIIQHDRFGTALKQARRTKTDRLNDNLQYARMSLHNPKVLGYFLRRFDQQLRRAQKTNMLRCRHFRETFFTELSPVFYQSVEQIQRDPPLCDGFVCGSDQIWNPSRFEGAAPFFLDFGGDSAVRIAYAPSLGVERIPEEMWPQYKKWLERFQAVSVREKSACGAIEAAAGIRPAWVLDPTFLMNREQWEKLAIEDPDRRKKYILCYFLGKENFICAYKSIRETARRLDADIVVLPLGRHSITKGLVSDRQLCGPQEFLGYLKNAEYVMTDSFHGTALSINFGKEFASFRGRKNSVFTQKFNRIQNILDALGLENRVFDEDCMPRLEPIDYEAVYQRLRVLVDVSKDYLANALKQVKKLDFDLPVPYLASPQTCTGCTACMAVCPKGAIRMEKDAAGFWRPVIDTDSCISCNACTRACPVRSADCSRTKPISQFAFYLKDRKLRAEGSSGNAFGAFARTWLSTDNGVVYGSAMEADCCSASCRSTEEVPLSALQKSKYFESTMGDAISRMKRDLQSGKRVLFCGTPCQTAAARSVLGSPEELLLVDFLCHGVPSADWYKKYLLEMEKKYNAKAVSVDMRAKVIGWTPNTIEIRFDNGRVYQNNNFLDPYLFDFGMNKHLRECCYNCSRVVCSCADITIGDYWAAKKKKNVPNSNDGISVVRTNTAKGEGFLQKILESPAVFTAALDESDTDETFFRRSRKIPRGFNTYPERFPIRPKRQAGNRIRGIYYEIHFRKLLRRFKRYASEKNM